MVLADHKEGSVGADPIVAFPVSRFGLFLWFDEAASPGLASRIRKMSRLDRIAATAADCAQEAIMGTQFPGGSVTISPYGRYECPQIQTEPQGRSIVRLDGVAISIDGQRQYTQRSVVAIPESGGSRRFHLKVWTRVVGSPGEPEHGLGAPFLERARQLNERIATTTAEGILGDDIGHVTERYRVIIEAANASDQTCRAVLSDIHGKDTREVAQILSSPSEYSGYVKRVLLEFGYKVSDHDGQLIAQPPQWHTSNNDQGWRTLSGPGLDAVFHQTLSSDCAWLTGFVYAPATDVDDAVRTPAVEVTGLLEEEIGDIAA